MAPKFSTAAIALGYALYDSEHTSRLGEQGEEVQREYFKRGRDIIYALEYRPATEIEDIIKEIER